VVLELGCGAGLPGIQALKQDAKLVIFSDYNDDVLLENTWRNIMLNTESLDRARCYAGDWDDLHMHIQKSHE
jgi:predicted nicotinamide N-methyase